MAALPLPIDHRPWPVPSRPWAMSMVWRDLAFLHWPVKPDSLRPLVPPGLAIDTLDGHGWLGVVPFAMQAVCPRFTPRIAPLSDFLELNLRTYVTHNGKPGVFFFSLDAANWLAVRLARRCFHLPYFDAHMRCENHGECFHYRSQRTHRDAPKASFEGIYQPTEKLSPAIPGTAEHWLTERYCLYAASANGRTFRGDIHHAPWPLQRAECDILTNHLGEQIGIPLTGPPVYAHFARHLYVRAWLLEPVSGTR